MNVKQCFVYVGELSDFLLNVKPCFAYVGELSDFLMNVKPCFLYVGELSDFLMNVKPCFVYVGELSDFLMNVLLPDMDRDKSMVDIKWINVDEMFVDSFANCSRAIRSESQTVRYRNTAGMFMAFYLTETEITKNLVWQVNLHFYVALWLSKKAHF